MRKLGIPSVLDRFIQQAVLQVLQRQWDRTFSDHSYGFRPGRSAHQAVAQAQQYVAEGYSWVVDFDLEKFFDQSLVAALKGILKRFMEALSCIDQCFIADDLLERLPAATQVGKTKVGGIDLNKPRMRLVVQAVIALSASPDGFTASELADRVRALGKHSQSHYGPCRAAYDLKKLRGKHIVRRIGRTRRYQPLPAGLRAMTALIVLRNKAIKPLLAAAEQLRPTRGAQNPRPIDVHYAAIRLAMRGVFDELGLAA